jgi:YidC/Oxa1 family membrane protein insertase
MPPTPNRTLRLLIPVVLSLAAVLVGVAVFVGSAPSKQPPAPAGGTASAPEVPAPEVTVAENPAPQVAAPAPEPAATAEPVQPSELVQPAEAAAPAVRLRVRVSEVGAYTPIGDLDPDTGHALRIEFSRIGAGVASLRMASEFESVAAAAAWRTTGALNEPDHVQVQREHTAGNQVLTPFASLWAEVDGAIVFLGGEGAWRELSPGVFRSVIEDATGAEVLRLTRAYVLTEGSRDVLLSQRVENVSGTPRNIRLVGFGPADLPADAVTYGGDKRRLRFGYLFKPELDPGRDVVVASKFLTPRADVLGPRQSGVTAVNPLTGQSFTPYEPTRQVWPNTISQDAQYTLAWAGLTSRYFAVAVHGVIDPDAADPVKTFDTVEKIDRVVLQAPTQPDDGVIALQLHSPVTALAPGSSAELGLRFYAGPLHEPTIRGTRGAGVAGIDEIVTYNFGGLCAPCTFTWLTGPLLAVLRLLHAGVGDWSLAIVLLVFCVRGVLHPVNRWSQIRVQRFGKQMQDMAPKQKKIQEKFKDDRARMQQEMAKLWREEGVNPAGMLGCLPMLLQSPVWIALYASLYFVYDLRHEPALFGVFQSITGGSWLFLADLAEPDALVPLPASMHVTIPLMGPIRSINILPLVLAVVYYIHMKFMSPPTSATMTPEQEQTQKLAKWITVVMFPVIMYAAPSGLAIYFIANSTTAIIENTWIRRHIKAHNLLEVTKKPRKSGGLLARLQQIAEEQQRARAQQRQPGSALPGGKGESAAQRAIRKAGRPTDKS